MASDWLEAANQSLQEDGFLALQDFEVGNRLEAFQSEGFPWRTLRGLESVEAVLFDPRIRDILKAQHAKFILGHRLRYSAKPGCHRRFWDGGPSAFFVVHEWAKGSTVECWVGSHQVAIQHDSEATGAPVFEYAKEKLEATGCKSKTFHFPRGGLLIADARVIWDMQAGYEIVNVFFTPELLPGLAMELPDSPRLAEKLGNMMEKTGDLGINFKISSDWKSES
ncbi:hypothetical protein PG994_006931 [Apiospora phragmitis]|uniref:Uncharacterized protein n=1 Tax=Apiospora phragmitis TaxID=2905665 RepID=A0ABR1VGF7_9PEZI